MTAHRIAALSLLVVSAGYATLATRIEEAFALPGFALGPRAFPLFVGVVGILLSLVLVLAPDAAQAPPRPGATAPAVTASRRTLGGDWRRTLALCAMTLLYAVALPRAGFALSTALFLAASFRLLGERRAAMLAVVPLAVALTVLATMRGFLGVHLPEPLLDALSRLD